MGRKVVGLLVGLLCLGAVVMTLQQLAAALHPLPEGLDPMNPDDADAFARHLAGMPGGAWILGFLSEILGAAFGAAVAGWIGRSTKALPAVVVGLALVGSVVNWTSFAHPLWFIGGQLVGYPAVWLGVTKLLERTRPPAAAEGLA